jgi:ribonucleoside-diphosphate reductase alpha chain
MMCNEEVLWAKDEVAYNVFRAKYAKDDMESPAMFCQRVASICDESIRDRVECLLANGAFFFGGRTMYLAGRKNEINAAGSNCYVVPIEDDTIEAIYEANKHMARIFSKGGGVGTDISILRPRNAKVNNAAKSSTGAVSFLDLFNETGNVISQHGRRGATMVSIDCSHPDIEELLDTKMKGDRLQSMNVSIKFTDEFMTAVDCDKPYTLKFDVKSTGEHIEKTIKAREFFKKFCECQWNWGDPGALFIDRFDEYNLLSGYDNFHILTTNPCAELPLGAWGSCNLGSINLAKFVHMPTGKFCWDSFIDTVHVAVRALNDALDYSYDKQPYEENRKYIRDWRPIGLGVFGYADMLVELGLEYGSEKALEFTRKLFHCLTNEAVKASALLCQDYFNTFGEYDYDKTADSKFFQSLDDDTKECVKEHGLLNGQIISVAPTGSISLLAGRYTGGCEPIYKLYYERTTHKLEEQGKTFRVFSHSIEDLLARNELPMDTSAEDIKKMFPYVIESHDVEPIRRILTQATMQKYVDNSISSTVNLPESATPDDIFAIYDAAWQAGCKGITVFRDNCARGNILGLSKKEEKPTILHDSLKPERRGDIGTLVGKTYTQVMGDGTKLYITVNWKDDKLFEIFVNSERHKDEVDGITRLISLSMRCGVSIDAIIKQLFKLNADSVGFAVGMTLNDAYTLDSHEPIVQEVEVEDRPREMECPECHSKNVKLSGHCWQCDSCGASGCAV